MSLNQVKNIQDGNETFELWSNGDGRSIGNIEYKPFISSANWSVIASGGERVLNSISAKNGC